MATEHEGDSTLLGTDTEKSPGSAPGMNPVFNQNGVLPDSGAGPLAGASLLVPIEPAQESAWMDHEVFLMVADFFPLPFRCS
jgi:hypothetical protein